MQKLSKDDSGHLINQCISEALQNLGVSENNLISAMKTYNRRSALNRRGVLNYRFLSVGDWMWLCNFLYMPLDPITGDWLKHYQRSHACAAILEGRFFLPMNKEIRAKLVEFLHQEKSSIRYNKKAYGSPLLERVIIERRQKVKARRMMRLENRIRTTTTKNAYQPLSTD